jgi:hypothetical protein
MSSKTSAYWFAPNMSCVEKDFAAADRLRSAQLSEPRADRGPQPGSPAGVVDATGTVLNRDY